MLEFLKSIFATSQGLAGLLHVHLGAEAVCQVLCKIARSVFSQVDTLSCEHFVCLILDNVHLLAKFDFAAVKIHQQVNM